MNLVRAYLEVPAFTMGTHDPVQEHIGDAVGDRGIAMQSGDEVLILNVDIVAGTVHQLLISLQDARLWSRKHQDVR